MVNLNEEKTVQGWLDGPEPKPLSPGVVRIWHMRNIDVLSDCDKWYGLLSREERTRALRYKFDADRRSFVLRRGMLRDLVGQCLGIEPGSVGFEEGSHGKLSVSDDCHGRMISFNLSKSRKRCVVAISTYSEIGIDIEEFREICEALDIAKLYFTPQETAVLAETDPSQRSGSFLRLWTRKEAVIKAMGRGLSIPLNTFSVLSSVARFRCGSMDQTWHVRDVVLDGSCHGAIALSADANSIDVRDYPLG